MNAQAFDIQRMTPRARWAAACLAFAFVLKFAALAVGLAGMRSVAIVAFGAAFANILAAVWLCVSDMARGR